MPTEDRSNRTRIQFLRARTIVSHGIQKQKTPDASYQTDVDLGELTRVIKDVSGIKTETGCGAECLPSGSDIITLDAGTTPFGPYRIQLSSPIRILFTNQTIQLDQYTFKGPLPTFTSRNTITFQIIGSKIQYIESIAFTAEPPDGPFDFTNTTITSSANTTGWTRATGTPDYCTIVNTPTGLPLGLPLGLVSGSTVTVTLPFSVTRLVVILASKVN